MVLRFGFICKCDWVGKFYEIICCFFVFVYLKEYGNFLIWINFVGKKGFVYLNF